MKYITPTQWSHRSIERFRGELDKVQHMVDYWEAECKNKAFGEICLFPVFFRQVFQNTNSKNNTT